MPIGSSLGVTLPEPGVTTDWGDDLNTAIETIVEAVEGEVPSTALDVVSDIDYQGNGASNVGPVEFDAQGASLTSAGDENKVYVVGGELYFTDGSLNDVQLTASGAINSASTGAISGAGYGSGGVVISWDGTDYNANDGAGSYSNVRVGGLYLSDNTDQILLSPGTVGTSYTLTLPANAPAGQRFVQCDASGQLSYSNAVGSDVDFGAYDTTHESRWLSIGASAFETNDSWDRFVSTSSSSVSGNYLQATSSSAYAFTSLNLREGDTIESVVFGISSNTSGTIRVSLFRENYSGSDTVLETTSTTSTGSLSVTLTVDPVAEVSSQSYTYGIGVAVTSYAGQVRLYGARVKYKRV